MSDPQPIEAPPPDPAPTCAVPGDDRLALKSGFCQQHQDDLPGGWVFKREQDPANAVWLNRCLVRLGYPEQ